MSQSVLTQGEIREEGGIEKKVFSIASPKKGEIAVFRWPPDPSFDYIKRVIGEPGDHVVYHNKVLTINGQEMKQRFIEYTIAESSGRPVAKYEEMINGVKHDIFIRTDVPSRDVDVHVPKDHYFMMGDNRDNSLDSRYWGFVPDQNIVGRAFLIWMNFGKFGRIGTFN